MVKAMDYGIVVSEFIPESRYYVHLWLFLHFMVNAHFLFVFVWGVIIYTYLSMEVNYGNKFDSMKKIEKQSILNADWMVMILFSIYIFSSPINLIKNIHLYPRGYPCGVMVKAMDYGIIVSEFELQSRYYVHFRANSLMKGMNPLFLPAMG